MSGLSEFEFPRMFRMSRVSIGKLLDLIKTKISLSTPRGIQQAINSSGSYIPSVTKLAATIRWLAGGSYLDIAFEFGLDPANFFSKHYFLWNTINAIDEVIKLGFSTNHQNLSDTAQGFSKFSKGQMTGCVLAIHGWVCHTRQPKRSEVGDCITSYRNRKCCWGLIVLAGCDASCRFTLISARLFSMGHVNSLKF